MTYDPKQYWLQRGRVYKENFRTNKRFELQQKTLVEYLKGIDFTTVLEVGCGFGRITRLISSNFELERYLAIDVSPDQIANAREYVSSQKVNFEVSDVQSLILAEKYDLVIACEVLMHVLPDEISSVVKKLVSLSRKHIINIDWYEESVPRNIGSHNFIHQYESIYKSIPEVKNISRTKICENRFLKSLDTKQSIFHATIQFEHK